jgi:acetyltransferase-like isoleucine patch superfamily enzyme
LPAPVVALRLGLAVFLVLRSFYYFLLRFFLAEPLFKAYCKKRGRFVRTGIHLPWIQGKGDLLVGEDVSIDGKLNVSFAARFSDHPTLSIGDHTGIGHNCSFTIGKRITIGRHCRLSTDIIMFDSSGHALDPQARLLGLPPDDEEVKPITIGDNVWIGRRVIVHAGVTIGEGSVISSGAVVVSDIAPYTVVAGNPARKIATLNPTS